MAVRDNGTDLQLFTMGVPFYSARGLNQTLQPIRAIAGNRQNLRRDINGNLVNITPPEFLKYASKISATDQRPPAVDSVWPGTLVTVFCIAYLSYAVGGTAGRTEVSGSSFEENGFIFYRPALAMMVMDFNMDDGEWSGEIRWELELEEV